MCGENTGEHARQQWRTTGDDSAGRSDGAVWPIGSGGGQSGDVVPGRVFGVVDYAIAVGIRLDTNVDYVKRDEPDRGVVGTGYQQLPCKRIACASSSPWALFSR